MLFVYARSFPVKKSKSSVLAEGVQETPVSRLFGMW